MKSKVKQLLLLFWLLMVKQALAENTELIERHWDFGIGIGFGEQSNPFVGADDVPGYLTLDLALYGERFFFDNGDLGFTLLDRPSYGLNLLANYSSERIYYSYFNELGILRSGLGVSGSEFLFSIVPLSQVSAIGTSPSGDFSTLVIPDRDFALNLGLELLVNTAVGQIQWQIAKDVSGAHDGTQVELDFNRTWVKGRWALKSNVGLNWKSDELVDYYYGFENLTEAFFLRYKGQASTNYNLGFILSYRINNYLSYVNHFKYTHLGSGIQKSPLIDSNNTQSYYSGLYYRF